MNLLIILGIVVILAIIIASMYNSLVKLKTTVKMHLPTLMYS